MLDRYEQTLFALRQPKNKTTWKYQGELNWKQVSFAFILMSQV